MTLLLPLRYFTFVYLDLILTLVYYFTIRIGTIIVLLLGFKNNDISSSKHLLNIYFSFTLVYTMLGLLWFIIHNRFQTSQSLPPSLISFANLVRQMTSCFKEGFLGKENQQQPNTSLEARGEEYGNRLRRKSSAQIFQQQTMAIKRQALRNLNSIPLQQKCDKCQISMCEKCEKQKEEREEREHEIEESKAYLSTLNSFMSFSLSTFIFVCNLSILICYT